MMAWAEPGSTWLDQRDDNNMFAIARLTESQRLRLRLR